MGGILAGLGPARDALRGRILARTADQAINSLGLDMLLASIRGPRYLTTRWIDLARRAGAAVGGMLHDPVTSLEWLAGLARQSAELAAQYGSHLADDTPADRGAPPVRLKISLDHVEHDLLNEPLVL
jgi:hypothetical protein